MGRKKIVVIGGGTGTAVLLRGLRDAPVDVTAIVSSSDSGSSSGHLRRQLGIVPVGDLRQCLLASSHIPKEEKELWSARFTNGTFASSPLGNFFLALLLTRHKTVARAMDAARRFWLATATVLPVTARPTTLCARYGDGTVVCGEHVIDGSDRHGVITRLWLRDNQNMLPEARRAIMRAALIVLAPGDLYTSILPPLLVSGVASSLAQTSAPIVAVSPLMTKRGQTSHLTVSRYVTELNARLFPHRSVDVVVVNTGAIPSSVRARYRASGETSFCFDQEETAQGVPVVVTKALLSHQRISVVPGDPLRRSMIRHDPAKLARVIMKIIRRG
jgi:uncharacterized cofD-like protein